MRKFQADADWIGTCSEEKLALEVNFWCGREATYQSADDRTASALTVFRSGHGRCGRNLCLRQTPCGAWAFRQDRCMRQNGPTVTTITPGQKCLWMVHGISWEPVNRQARLDHGWFNGASSRAMLVHSRWFDSAQPQAEEMAGKEGMTVLLNQLERYADTEKVCVTVRDESGMPVPDALAAFQVLNYASLLPLQSF